VSDESKRELVELLEDVLHQLRNAVAHGPGEAKRPLLPFGVHDVSVKISLADAGLELNVAGPDVGAGFAGRGWDTANFVRPMCIFVPAYSSVAAETVTIISGEKAFTVTANRGGPPVLISLDA